MTNATSPTRRGLSRRQFLKIAGVAGATTVPLAFGYRWVADDSANLPNTRSPYARDPGWAVTDAPILVVVNNRVEHPFGAYLAEILRAEGLNCFRITRLAALDREMLARCALVIVSAGAWTRAESDRFSAYVANGGKLIALRPEASALFGVEQAAGVRAETNLKIESRYASGMNSPLQIHAAADSYRVTSAEIVARLTDDVGTRGDFPAVTLNRFGKGQAALWAFDLAQSIAYTRQGNPQWANQERDGREGIRAVDAFVGWMDLKRCEIPQADEQMRLFSRLINEMLTDVLPLPRVWYFPSQMDALLIATGDAHQAPAEAVEQVLARVESFGGRMSIYYTPGFWNGWRRGVFKVGGADALALFGGRWVEPTPTQVAQWRARGHEFGFHPYVEEGLENGARRYWQEFSTHGYAPVAPTVRTHRILWTGWVETARVQAGFGIRMNLDYYHYGTAFQRASGDWAYGYFTGSGVPMKFVDEQGRVLDILQQATQLVDEHLMKMPWGGGWANLTGDAAAHIARAAIDRALRDAPAALGAQFHVDPFAAGGDFAANATRFLDGTLAYAASRGMPIWNAEHWLRWSDTRHDAAFENLVWDATARRLAFQVTSRAAADVTMEILVPAQFNARRVARVEMDGAMVNTRARAVSGAEFAAIAMMAGTHRVVAMYE
ncbi:MAG: twin-arginine translocation signal domain-containing protein [Chloroflexi bacterium]|nr:twin-arginine translocation signal domain-containing protein [Chloroflexota bacterium]